jgi:colanic acid biosynthesis glycosyl transferase WcaI
MGTKHLRILFLGLNYSPELTGIGKYSGEMMEWLAARGHEVRVITAPPYYPGWRVGDGYSTWSYRSEVSAAGVQIFRCPLWVPAHPNGRRRVLHLFSFALSSLPLMVASMAWRPDLVLTVEPAFMCVPAALLTARVAGAQSWLHIQDFEVDAAFELGLLAPGGWVQRLALRIERTFMGGFARVSTISTRMAERLSAKGVEPACTSLFPNWVDTECTYPLERASSMRAELGIAPDRTVALYSGNMGGKQGLEILPEIAERLRENKKVHFVFCGDGPYRARLEKPLVGFENVTLLPLQPLERLNELLNLADIHLLPQRADAADLVMPSKLTGMLASGRPVVATAVHGRQITASLEGRGIVVTPGNADSFAAALLALADAPEEREKMGRAARHFAEQELARDMLLERFEREITTLCSKVETTVLSQRTTPGDLLE